MPTPVWQGSARAVAQVNTFVFAGTWEADDVIRVSFSNGKRYDFTAGSTVIATVLSTLVTNWLALDDSDYPEFAEITPTANATTLTCTAATPGKPFTVTLTPLEANLGAADAQTIEGAGTATTGTAATVSSGPNDWSTAANWSGGAIPADADDIRIENSAVSILYGLAQSAVEPATFNVAASFTGTIGLPRTNIDAASYVEYRDLYLQLGPVAASIGYGEGPGSGRIKLDCTSDQTALTVYSTGAAIEPGVPAFLWKGTHASNVVEVQAGDVGIAVFAGETATILTLQIAGNSKVWGGAGLTLTTLKQDAEATDVFFEGTGTTLTLTKGKLSVKGGNITTLTNNAGTVYYLGAGTIGTYKGGDGSTLDCTKDLTTRTITTTNLFKGATINDPFGTIVFTNGYIPMGCLPNEVNANIGYNRTLTPTPL